MCKFLSSIYDVTLIAVHPRDEIKDKVHIIPFTRYHNRKFRILFGWLFMFFKAIRVNARIYHLHDPELIPCGILLRACGKKVILDIHENIAEDLFDKPWIKRQKLVFTIFTFFEKIACQMFYIVLAERSYEKRYNKMCKHISTVQNFCDTEFFAPYEKTDYKDTLHLYYIGIILENRGILQILDTIYLLKKEGIQAEFHCVGELYTDLDRKIKNLKYYKEIENQIHFYGRLPLEEGYMMAKNMDVGLCLIWPMKNSIESYPTKLFEYMRCGLPIITSNFPLYREVIEENNCGVCIDPLNTDKLKKELIAIHMDVKKSELMAKNGKKTVFEKYDWKSQTPIISKVYDILSR
jgi:glycosyltransferase involved in cell wall biosynthesis